MAQGCDMNLKSPVDTGLLIGFGAGLLTKGGRPRPYDWSDTGPRDFCSQPGAVLLLDATPPLSVHTQDILLAPFRWPLAAAATGALPLGTFDLMLSPRMVHHL